MPSLSATSRYSAELRASIRLRPLLCQERGIETTDITDLIGSAAYWLSLALVLASFPVYRVKTIRSFQFEMLVVLLVITLSEVPKILDEIGLINISDIETTGLEIHTVAMVFLAAFIALRATKYLKE